MKKSFLFLLLIAGLFAMSFGVVTEKSPYKNLKVLPKNISKQQLDSIMKHFTVALNVKCNFCHVRNADNTAWEFHRDDNKHKLIARDMIRMTKKLNEKYFGVTKNQGFDTKLHVTCYTCHNGSKEPAIAPAPKQQPAPAPPAPVADTTHKHDH